MCDIDHESLNINRKPSFVSRVGSIFQKKDVITYDGDDIPLTINTPAADELHEFNKINCLLTGNQYLKPPASLKLSTQWYSAYLKNNFEIHGSMFKSALNDGNESPVPPGSGDVVRAARFVREVAELLIHQKDLALVEIVDKLNNDKHFKQQDEEDDDDRDDRIFHNQLVFAAVGWLLFLYDIHPRQSPDTLHAKHVLTTMDDTREILTTRNVNHHVHVDKPLWTLLNSFGNFVPELKVESQNHSINRSALPTRAIDVETVCFRTINSVELHIEWTDSIAFHLDLDTERRTLKLFRFPSYCRIMSHRKNIHHRLIVDYMTTIRESRREVQVVTEGLFRELLLSYRLIFGQDEKSWKAFLRYLPKWNQQWNSTNSRHQIQPSDPLLPILGGRSCQDSTAKAIYDEIEAGKPIDSYNSSQDFPIYGEKLRDLQNYVEKYKPTTFFGLLTNRRNDTYIRFNLWTNWLVLFFASLAAFLALLQLAVQIWAIMIQKQQLAQPVQVVLSPSG